MKYVIGLGNPGKEYLWTRHNIGFQVVEATAINYYKKDSYSLPNWKLVKDLQAYCYSSGSVTFVCPETFVNETGRVAATLLKQKKADLSDLFFVCDDVNMEFGKLRLRVSGSSGGHHGLESVINSVASEDFCRLRIGVGQPNMPKDLTEFVLGQFDSSEMKNMEIVLKKTSSVCHEWIEKDFESAMKMLSTVQSPVVP